MMNLPQVFDADHEVAGRHARQRQVQHARVLRGAGRHVCRVAEVAAQVELGSDTNLLRAFGVVKNISLLTLSINYT